jgi:hypothetical protein
LSSGPLPGCNAMWVVPAYLRQQVCNAKCGQHCLLATGTCPDVGTKGVTLAREAKVSGGVSGSDGRRSECSIGAATLCGVSRVHY